MFGKKKEIAEILDDKVFLTTEEKIEAMLTGIELCQRTSDVVFVVTFFHDQFEELREAMDEKVIAYRFYDKVRQRYETANAVGNSTTRVLLIPADILSGIGGGITGEEKDGLITVLVAGHHPLLKHDEAISQFANTFQRKTKITFYQAFEDQLLLQFGGERIKQLVTSLGLEKGEAISHPMVTKAIRNAQEKLSQKINSDIPETTEKAWFERNVQ